jgi:hypothetical protein
LESGTGFSSSAAAGVAGDVVEDVAVVVADAGPAGAAVAARGAADAKKGPAEVVRLPECVRSEKWEELVVLPSSSDVKEDEDGSDMEGCRCGSVDKTPFSEDSGASLLEAAAGDVFGGRSVPAVSDLFLATVASLESFLPWSVEMSDAAPAATVCAASDFFVVSDVDKAGTDVLDMVGVATVTVVVALTLLLDDDEEEANLPFPSSDLSEMVP